MITRRTKTMKVKDLISHLIAKDIYIATQNELKYYSNDGGISFKRGVLSNPDPDLTYKIYNSVVKWLKPENNYAVYIMIE